MTFRPIRRVKNERPEEEAYELLKTCRRAAFSVHGENGYPYTIPINFYYDEEDHCIYFHSARSGHKIDALKENSKVCFTVWDDGYLEEGDWAYHVTSCVVFGQASFVRDLEIAKAKIRQFALKYYPTAEEVEDQIVKGFDRVQMIRIDIDRITAKRVHEK